MKQLIAWFCALMALCGTSLAQENNPTGIGIAFGVGPSTIEDEDGPGDTFDLLDFASRSGVFTTVNLPSLGGGMTWDQSRLYTTGELLVLSSLSGDYNNDGLVDAADYTVWRDNFGAPAGTLPNDTAGGMIGTAQYDAWVAGFGQSVPAVSVPEPGTLIMCSLALFALARRRGAIRPGSMTRG